MKGYYFVLFNLINLQFPVVERKYQAGSRVFIFADKKIDRTKKIGYLLPVVG
jgi:hypothetical protein